MAPVNEKPERIGRYEVLSHLARNDQRQTVLAQLKGVGSFKQLVVIKLLSKEATPRQRQAFVDEATTLSRLRHPNIVRGLDLFDDEREGLALVLEYVDGQTVESIVARCVEQQRPLPIALSVAIAREVCIGLHAAHALQVIHRDVSPANIIVSYDGAVRLLDFGLARAATNRVVTNPGMTKGTLGYLSPEQARGEKLDARSDVFSIGVVLWELLTGRRLFEGRSDVEELELVAYGPVVDPRTFNPSLDERLATTVMRALQRDAPRRFQSALDFAEALPVGMAVDQRAMLVGSLFEKERAQLTAMFNQAVATTVVSGTQTEEAALLKTDDDQLLALQLKAERLGTSDRAVPFLTGPFFLAIGLILFASVLYGSC